MLWCHVHNMNRVACSDAGVGNEQEHIHDRAMYYKKICICIDTLLLQVIVGVRDPNPLVNNAGVDTLTRAGINVAYIGGEEEQECFDINKDFMERMASSK